MYRSAHGVIKIARVSRVMWNRMVEDQQVCDSDDTWITESLSMTYQKPIDSLIRPKNFASVEECKEDVQYITYPDDATSRARNFESCAYERLHPSVTFLRMIDCLHDDFDLEVLVCYVLVCINVVLSVVSCGFLVLGSWNLLREGSLLKWNGIHRGGSSAATHGTRGTEFLLVAFLLDAVHMLVAFVCTFLSKWRRSCRGMHIAWAENALHDLIRQILFFLSSTLVAAGYYYTLSGSYTSHETLAHLENGIQYLQDGDVLTMRTLLAHPSIVLSSLDVNVSRVEEIQAHHIRYIAASPSGNALVVCGMAVRLLMLLVQFVLGDGCNLFYILPVGRCGYEWSKVAAVCKDVTQVPTDMPFESFWLDGERRNACGPWCATFLHNVFGAFRMHLYWGVVFLFTGSVLQLFSVVSPYDDIEHWPVFVPWKGATKYHSFLTFVGHSRNATNIDEWEDASYFLWTGGLLYVVASVFTVIGTAAYVAGLLTTRSSTPGNHYVQENVCLRFLWP